MDFTSFDGSARSRNAINLRGRSSKEDKKTLMKKAREERQARQLMRARLNSAFLIQRWYRAAVAIKKAKISEMAHWEALAGQCIQSGQMQSFETIYKLINSFLFGISIAYSHIGHWKLCASFLLSPITKEYRNGPPKHHETSWIRQQRQLFHFLLCMSESVPLTSPELMTPEIIELMKFFYHGATKNQSFDYVANDDYLVLNLAKWHGTHAQLSDFLFHVISDTLDNVKGENKEVLSRRFVEYFIIDIRKHIRTMREEMVKHLLTIIPKLSTLSSFLTTQCEFNEQSIAPILVLFDLCLRNPSILPFVLQGFSVEKVNEIISKEKASMDIDSSGDEFYSDDEDNFDTLSISRQLMISLGKFTSLEFLKEFVPVAFPDKGETNISDNLIALCRLGIILYEISTRDNNACFDLLNNLAFYFRIVPKMWNTLLQSKYISNFDPLNIKKSQEFILMFFCLVCQRWLLAIDDHEFFDSQEFLPMEEWKSMTTFLKNIVVSQYRCNYEHLMQSHKTNYNKSFTSCVSKLLQQIYERDCRISFTDEGWISPEVTAIFQDDENSQLQIITNTPFFIPLDDRFKLFHDQVSKEKQMVDNTFHRMPRIKINRNNLFEEGYDKLSCMTTETMRSKFRVEFINSSGLEEAGIDGGGLFKEFITAMLHKGFNPENGLFTYSRDNELYPHPNATEVIEDCNKMYHFLGRLLGKSLYELVLVHLPLSRFFISRILKKTVNHLVDLSILDPDLYDGLMKLKNYRGDVEKDLDLTFSITEDSFGTKKTIDLIPGGRNKPVTSQNRMKYIFAMARYRITVKIKPQVENFLSGFYEIIPHSWIQMFNEAEFQQLISGIEGTLDLVDFRNNTKYANGYSNEHPTIEIFWQVLGSLSPQQQRKFLQFVTSSERSPLLGFSYLEPKFCIQQGEDINRLPTAGTCFNLLKLPPYLNFETMRAKLVYAIESNSGFEMS